MIKMITIHKNQNDQSEQIDQNNLSDRVDQNDHNDREKWSKFYVNPLTKIAYSTQNTIKSIVKQTAEYPNLLRNVIKNPKPTNNITWMSKITENQKLD